MKNCGTCRFSASLDAKLREFYPLMKLQCNRQDFPGAMVVTNATVIVMESHKCFEYEKKKVCTDTSPIDRSVTYGTESKASL